MPSIVHRTGRVYLVGAGPGDPKLLTLRGKECLEEADVVIYDYLANPALLRHATKTAIELIYVGRRGRGHYLDQDEINALLVAKTKEGKTVLRLKGGDPFIFGRGGEEAEFVANASIPFEVVPGISSALACPAYAGIPITHRSLASSVTIVTGHEDPAKSTSFVPWKSLAQKKETLVVLMGMRNLSSIVRSLLDEGKPPTTPVALIRWGTRSVQRTVIGTLQDIVKLSITARIDPPAIVVIGDVVMLREKLNWYEQRPLFGKKIMLTRALPQAQECSDLLYRYGAETVECPTIEMIPPSDTTELHHAIDNIDRYDWAVFTSVNGVTYFMRHLYDRNQDLRVLHNLRICCIGPRTAQELRAHGLIPDIVPELFQAEGVIDALTPLGLNGKRVLIPRAEVAREILPDTFRALGAEVTVPAVYRTVQPKHDVVWAMEMLRRHEISVITFTSSSTVRNFVDLFGGRGHVDELLSQTRIASIGPITSGTLNDFGLMPVITAKENTIPALVAAIVDYFQS